MGLRHLGRHGGDRNDSCDHLVDGSSVAARSRGWLSHSTHVSVSSIELVPAGSETFQQKARGGGQMDTASRS